MIHLIYNLERHIYINELFVLIGALLLIIHSPKYLKPKQDKIIIIVLFLFLYGFIYAIISFFFLRDGSVYQFARTLPVWYSILAFFLGIEFYNCVLKLNKFWILKNNADLVNVINIFIGGRLSNFSLIPLFSNRKNYFLKVLFFVVALALYKGGLTSYIMVFSFVILLAIFRNHFLQNLLLNRLLIIIMIVVFFYFLYYVYNKYADFYLYGYNVFENILTDGNMIWRLMFWAYEFSENILKHPIFGIGFGTEFFDISRDNLAFILQNRQDFIDLPYTLGPHNSYIYIFVRLGLVGFIPLVSIYLLIFHRIRKYGLFDDLNVVALLLSFVFISISALFNVVLESPLYSGIYWIILGMLFQAIDFGKRNSTRTFEYSYQ